MDNRKISIVIPTYNRYEMTIESFAQVLNDDRVKRILIVDDASTDGSFDKLWNYFGCNEGKVHVGYNPTNQDCYKNKRIAVLNSPTDYCILLDSDNIIGTDYLDAIFGIEWNEHTVYQPTFAKPHFDFRHLSGIFIDKLIVKNYLHDGVFTTALNAANFFVNRNTYLKAFDPDIDPVTSDSIYMAYRLLEQGNKYYFVPGLEYEHRIHSGSHYQNNVSRTPSGFHQSVLDKLAAL